jgi:hypothetical protein
MHNLTIEHLQKLPAIQAALAEAEAQALSQRAALIDDYSRAAVTFSTADAKDALADAKLAAELDEARERVRKLSDELSALRTDANARRLRWKRDGDKLRARIIVGADKRLRPFVLWAQRASNLVSYRSHGAPLATSGSGAQLLQESQRHVDIAHQVHELVQRAVETAERLQLHAVSAEQVDAELRPLRDRIMATAALVGVTIPADFAAVGGVY